MDGISFRNTWISLGIGLSVASIGMVLLRDHDETRALFGLVCVILMIVLRHVLDGQDLREPADD